MISCLGLQYTIVVAKLCNIDLKSRNSTSELLIIVVYVSFGFSMIGDLRLQYTVAIAKPCVFDLKCWKLTAKLLIVVL